MAIAIKAEFNTFDLADLTNDVVTVKEELAAMPMAQPEVTNSASEAVTPASTMTVVSAVPPTNSTSCAAASVGANAAELQLTDREKARLDELFLASRALVEPVEHERDVIQYECTHTKKCSEKTGRKFVTAHIRYLMF